MEPRIKLLPLWCITNTRPAFYDVESDTAVEMTGKVYAAMRELQTDYNKYVTEINKTITDFINGTIEDQECFEKRMTKVIHDYLDYLDTKVANQDKVIAEAVAFMKTNLKTSITELITQMHESGEFDEAVLNAIDNIGSRVNILEANVDDIKETNSDHETRIINLEANKLITEYKESDKKLVIYLLNEGGKQE